jgi:hypothetical protein
MAFLDGIFGSSSVPSSPTGQQTSTPSIQPWAQPYISNYLNATQNLIANQQTPALLNQSYVDAAGLQLPGGFASGQALAEAGGKGSLSTAPIALDYGRQGAQYGAQGVKYGETGAAMGTAASRAGDMYAAQATNPSSVQAYMNPYIQQSLAPQLAMLNQQQQIAAQGINGQAVGQGAFGGNRATLAQGLNAQNYDLARQQAIGQGYNQAFSQAQQAQQFGANLGLQGLQAGMQGQQVGLAGLGTAMQGSQVGLQGVGGAQQGYAGATQAGGTLGNIAAQQAQAKIAQLQLQNQFGMQQQMFPYQQQQFAQQAMANLPFTSTTQQVYQAPPNATSQIAGLGTAGVGAYGLYKLLGQKEGGQIKSYAGGGDVFAADLPAGGKGIGQFEQDQIDAINRSQSSMGAGLVVLPNPSMYPRLPDPSMGGAGMSDVIGAGMGPAFGGSNETIDLGTFPLTGAIPMGQIPQPGTPMSAGMGPAFGGSNEDYVNSLYANILGRQADQGGYQHNLDLLNSGKINQQGLANSFLASKEFENMPRRDYQLMGAGMPAASGLSDIRLNQLLGAA